MSVLVKVIKCAANGFKIEFQHFFFFSLSLSLELYISMYMVENALPLSDEHF